MKAAFLELSDAFKKAYSISFYSRRPLIDRCVKALEEGTPPIVSCPENNLRYVEINKCRVYITGHTLVGILFV